MWVYEHGIVVAGANPPPLRRIATDELPIYSQTTLVIVDCNGGSLSERLATVLHPQFAHKNAEWQDEKDARYALRASAYHLETLVRSYMRHTERGERNARRRHERGEAPAIWSAADDQRVYFEIDAFFGSARRFYEQLRKVLWKRFGRAGAAETGRPSNFRRTMKVIELPATLRETLESSWEQFGSQLKNYRDNVAHYDPLHPGHTNMRVYPMHDRWGLIVPLPINPEVRSRALFEFDLGPDALSFCHEVLCHLVGVAESVAEEIGA